MLSSNDEPLGHAVGNKVELMEAAQVLQGKGPDDVRQLVRVQVRLHQNWAAQEFSCFAFLTRIP